MLKVSMQQPQLHMTEDARWDYRVTIVFKNATVANEPDPVEETLAKQLFPDQENFKKEEQRRFEVLDGLQAGDEVVVSANFLIDSESRLQAGGFACMSASRRRYFNCNCGLWGWGRHLRRSFWARRGPGSGLGHSGTVRPG